MKSLFATLVLILFLVLLLGTSYLIYEEQTFILQSKATIAEVSRENSLAISTPTCVKADGEEISRLSVYCLDTKGLGKPQVQVSVSPTAEARNLHIQPIQGTTDQTGKAMFDITSQAEGIFDLTIVCGQTLVKNNHRTCFTSS